VLPAILHYNESVNTGWQDEVSQKIRTHYLGDKPVNRDTFSTFVDVSCCLRGYKSVTVYLLQILSDRLFISDIETAARLQNSAVKSNIFSYLFNYKGKVSKSTGRTKSPEYIGKFKQQ